MWPLWSWMCQEPALPSCLGWSPPGVIWLQATTAPAAWARGSRKAVATLLQQPCPCLHLTCQAGTVDPAVPFLASHSPFYTLVFTEPEPQAC